MKKALYNLFVGDIEYIAGKLYKAEDVAHIDQTNFIDVDEVPATATAEAELDTAPEDTNEPELKATVEEESTATDEEKATIFTITNKETGEAIKVQPKAFGKGFVKLAPLEDYDGEVVYTFNQSATDGTLSNGNYNIVKDEVVSQETSVEDNDEVIDGTEDTKEYDGPIAKYKILADDIEHTDQDGKVMGMLEVDSIQEVPEIVGDAWVADGKAEKVADETLE